MPRSTLDDPQSPSVPDLLRDARQAAGFTQKAAADAAGVDPQTISRWERGERRPSEADVNHLLGIYRRGRMVVREGTRQYVPRGTAGGLDPIAPGDYPRHLEGMVKRAEADIFDADLPDAMRDALLYALRNPELVTMYRMGYEERRQSADEQRAQMEAHITKIRALLEQMVADLNRQLRRS